MAKEDEWSEKLTFGAICDCLEAITKQSNKKIKYQMLSEFLTKCRKTMMEYSTNSADSVSLFPVLRMLLPLLDKERGSYGIKEVVLSKLFIDLLKIGPNSRDAKKLK